MKHLYISNDDAEELQRIGFEQHQILLLNVFLRDLHETARIYLVRIFVRAKLRKKTFAEIFDVTLKTFREVWQFGTPKRIGDPDDVTGDQGMKNTVGFYDIYKALGLPSPKFLF